MGRAGLVAGVLSLLVLGHIWAYPRPPTGIITLEELRAGAAYLKENASPQDEVFTASAIFPFVSGNPLVYNLSHPGWYQSKEVSEEMLRLYMPPFEEVLSYLERKEVPFVIVEPYTIQVYLLNRPEFGAYLASAYAEEEKIGRVQIYQRNNR